MAVASPQSTMVGVYEVADYIARGYWLDAEYVPPRFDISTGDTLTYNVDGVEPEAIWFIEHALEAWTAVSGIQFQKVTGSAGQIQFRDDDAGAYSYFNLNADDTIERSYVNVHPNWYQTHGSGQDFDTYSYQTYLHEIGHALGLGHPGNYNGSATTPDFDYDSWQMSVMSYFSQGENSHVNADIAYTLTPMTADIVAIQEIYGKYKGANVGNTVYGKSSNADGPAAAFLNPGHGSDWFDVTMTVFDSSGTDTFDFSGTWEGQTIDLRAGGISSVYGGRGNLIIAQGVTIECAIGGSGSDTIFGNSKANSLTGGQGDDSLYGGGGSDLLNGGAGRDRLDGGSGYDTLFGGQQSDYLFGKIGADRLIGGSGHDFIDGGLHNDRLIGGQGNDSLFGASGNDVLISGTGHDRVFGGDGSDVLHGDAGWDKLSGGRGNDRVIGGAGNDSLFGGGGADFLFGHVGHDRLVGGGGTDRVIGGQGGDQLYGGDGSDVLHGNAGWDTLFGGRGNDRLFGGDGADSVFGNTGRDRLFGGNGGDRLVGGRGHDRLYGGDGRDVLKGGAGRDVLNGGGGNDRLKGAGGNDRFVFAAGHDRILDFSEEQHDIIKIDRDLVGSGVTVRQMLQNKAVVKNGDTVIKFGDGNSLVVEGAHNKMELIDDISFF